MKAFIVFFLAVSFFRSYAQDAVILDRNVHLYTSINNEPVAFASNTFDVYINKVTGEFQTTIAVDNLFIAIGNPEMNITGENKGKNLTLKGVLPVNDVLNNNATVLNLKVEITVNFNDIDYKTFLTFSVLRKQPQGFSVMASGSFPHSAFEIKNLSNATDELGIQLSFTGY